jgi:spoIIIJ-associated protein
VAAATSSAEGSGKTVEAAVLAASAQLGVPPAQLEVEILEEPVASTFGVIGSPARVRVTVRGAPAEAAQVPATVAASASAAADSPAVDAPVLDSAVVERLPAAPATPAAQASSRPRGPRPPIEIDPELAAQQAELAADFVEGLLELLDLEAEITTWSDQSGGHVEVEGPDLDVLVGRDGDVLTALEEITRLSVVRSSGERARVSVDIDGFKQRRREELAVEARAIAERVRSQGLPEELPPMSAYERKIVHDVIAELDGVQTESIGEDPHRRVSILPA